MKSITSHVDKVLPVTLKDVIEYVVICQVFLMFWFQKLSAQLLSEDFDKILWLMMPVDMHN